LGARVLRWLQTGCGPRLRLRRELALDAVLALGHEGNAPARTLYAATGGRERLGCAAFDYDRGR
jgi:hypothetical protein